MESCSKTVSSYNNKYGAFPLHGGGLGRGLARSGRVILKLKMESCFKTVSSSTCQFAAIARKLRFPVHSLAKISENFRGNLENL